MVDIADDEVVPIKELVELYEQVGWLLYASDPDRLARAVDRSSYVVTARDDEGQLIGLARCLTDDVAVLYLQEVLVLPDLHRQHIGTQLVLKCLDTFSHVPQKVLLADADTDQHQFYQSLGFVNITTLERNPMHAFIRTHPELA